MLVFSLLAAASPAAELQWRKAGPKRSTPTADSRPIAKSTPPAAASAQPRRDGAVRQVRFETNEVEGPRFAAQQAAGTEMRSVVVDREASETFSDPGDDIRSAQLEFRPPSDQPDDRYGDQIRAPFGAEEQLEGESTEIELEEQVPLPPTDMTEEDLALPDESEPAPLMEQRQPPRTFQPAPPRDMPQTPYDESPGVERDVLADEGDQAQADCAEELAKLKARTIDQVNLSIAVTGTPGEDFPVECPIDDGTLFAGRCWCETTFMWKASALCHKPLYFEDEALERYGHSWGPCLDPFVSGAHFFCKLPVLPYCMGVTPPQECVYALGHYRPGSCAPYMIDPIPLSCRGAAFQAGAATGAAFVLP